MMSDTDKETSLLLQEPSANSDANSNANSNVGDDGGESDAVVAPSTERSSSLVGFADGFSTWSDSLQAFHLAIFHGLLYVGIGIVFYSFILETKLTIIESVYFSMTLLTTVGYGDISPDSSNAGMIFTIFFALYGIIILGIFLGILGDMLVERQEIKKEEVMKLASDAYLDTMLDKRPKAIDDELAKDSEHSFMYDVYKIAREQRVNIMVLFILAIPVIVLEKWGFVKGFYWIIITGSTIGLGDEHPTHEWSKLLCIVYLPLSVAFAGAFLGNIGKIHRSIRRDHAVVIVFDFVHSPMPFWFYFYSGSYLLCG